MAGPWPSRLSSSEPSSSPPEQVVLLIFADLLGCRQVTLIQSMRLTKYFGIKLPIVMGATFDGN